MEEEPVIYPQKLHFSCHLCSGCCRPPWQVVVTEEELARFKDYNWAASRARFQGRSFLESFNRPGLMRLAHVDNACIFLDDDNLCAIHRELGVEAKPRMCRKFPYVPIETPSGIVASFDFACSAVAADKGDPIEAQESEFRRIAGELRDLGNLAAGAGTAPTSFDATTSWIQAGPKVPLAWNDYVALEDGVRVLLEDPTKRLTDRLLLIDRLVAEAVHHAGPDEMAPWVGALRAKGWDPLGPAVTGQAISPLRQRAVIAPVIAWIEDAWARGFHQRSTTSDRVNLAVAIVPSRGQIRLPTADAVLSLAPMRRTRFGQDDVTLNAPIVRYLSALIAKKGLIAGTDVLQGSRYLALYFGTIRWYSVARAVLAGRDTVEVGDVQYAIHVVEATLSHAPALRSPFIKRLVNLLFSYVAPARSVYPSLYPS